MATKKTTQKQSKTIPTYSRTEFFQSSFWANHWMPAVVLMAISFALYGVTLGFGYLQDDQLFIWDNDFVQKGFAGLGQIFGHDSLLGYYKDPKLMLEGGRYRPIPLATFAIEIGLFGKDSAGVAHFFNVLLYGLTGILLYRVLLGLFPLGGNDTWFFNIPFLATCIFLLHPVHVEVVANIKSRDEILALLFSLAALWATMKFFDTGENRWRWFGAGFFLLGLLSKENTATFLAVIPLALWVFSSIPFGRIFSALWPMLSSIILFLILRAMALEKPIPHPDELVLNPFFGMSAAERFGSILFSLGWFLKLLFVPHPLTIDYYPYHVPRGDWSDWHVLLSAGIYVAMGIWLVRGLPKIREAKSKDWAVPIFCAAYFLLTISVVSNVFVRTSTFLNERYLFMPSVGFCLLLSWFLVKKLPELLGNPGGGQFWPSMVLAFSIFTLFGWRSWTRTMHWSGDGKKLVESAIMVSEGSYRANYYYANLLYQTQYLKLQNSAEENAATKKRRLLDAIGFYLNRSLKINPGYRLAAPLNIQVAVELYNQDKDLEGLLKHLEQLIQAQPSNGEMLTMTLEVLKSLKNSDPNTYNFFCHRVGYSFYFRKMQDPLGAIEFLNLGLANYPQDTNMMQDLIEVYTSMGNQAKVREMQQRIMGR